MEEKLLPKHIAIIMDGNRRWAREKGLDYRLGHKEGAENLKRIAKYANEIGIKYLTVYAFSTENWKRTKEEVGALMILLQKYLEEFLSSNDFDNIKINVLGDTSKLGEGLQKSITKILHETENNTGLVLNIAFNYGGRDEIVKAVKRISTEVKENKLDIDDINEGDLNELKVVSNKLINTGDILNIDAITNIISKYTEVTGVKIKGAYLNIKNKRLEETL